MRNSHAHHSVSELVQDVLNTLKGPWPEDITDQVCIAIENDRHWNNRYNQLVAGHGKRAVNSQIGRSTLQLTGLRNLGRRKTANSSLIKTYTCLGEV